jgi:glutathione S-transferase
MGNGFYAQKLDYKDWIYFNKAQRVHYNYLEFIAPAMAFIFIGGIRYGLISAIFGFIYFVGRLLYGIGYMTDTGARHPVRIVAAILSDLSFLSNFVIAIMTSI